MGTGALPRKSANGHDCHGLSFALRCHLKSLGDVWAALCPMELVGDGFILTTWGSWSHLCPPCPSGCPLDELRLHLYEKLCKQVPTARRKQDGDLAAEVLFQVLLCTPGQLKSTRSLSPGVSPVRKEAFFSREDSPPHWENRHQLQVLLRRAEGGNIPP